MNITETSYLSENGTRFAFNDYTLVTTIVNRLKTLMSRWGFVSVREFRKLVYDLSYDIEGEYDYGWYDPSDFYIKYVETTRHIEYHLCVRQAKKKEEFIAKKILADMVCGKVTDSLHDLTIKYLFGNRHKVDNSPKMSSERFKELLDELDGNSLNTLKEKNARYSTDGDTLHNFRSGAEVAGGTPAQACWGYMTKHLVALRDMVEKDDFSNREDFLEKCQDTINYIRFLWCIGNEEKEHTDNNKKESN